MTSLEIGLHGALHDAPFAHAELVALALVVSRLQAALEDVVLQRPVVGVVLTGVFNSQSFGGPGSVTNWVTRSVGSHSSVLQVWIQLKGVLLTIVWSGVNATVQQIFHTGGWVLIVFAVVLSVWDVSSAVRACGSGLNEVLATRDRRPAWLRGKNNRRSAAARTAATMA